MEHTRSGSLGRDVLVATAAVVGLYALTGVPFQPTQIPGYLLIVGFDVLEEIFGAADNYQVLFGAYLFGVGVAGGTVAHFAREWSARTNLPGWRVGLAGALAIVGTISLAFAAAVAAGTSQLAPVLVTATAGVVLLGAAGWLVGALDGLREHFGR